MAFLTGRTTFLRFHVVGPKPRHFSEEHLERLATRAAGKSRIASADGIDVGWTAGDHVLDTDFDLAKNIVNDSLHFEMRIDMDKTPSDLLRAYSAIELKALSKDNPSGLPSARQKREAKQAARERLEEEAKDGRFRKRTCVPVMWDALSNELLYGATSYTHLDRLTSHFQQTFGLKLEAVTAGRRAYQLAELHERTRAVDDSSPSKFVADSPAEIAWIADESSRDFLGNEFLLWLWYYLDQVDDTITLEDKSDLTVMMARSLSLECPRGQTGKGTISSEGPTRLPEAKRAVQAGKLPRKAGLTLVRHDQHYELSLQAESLGVGSCKLPAMPEDVTDPRARLEERVTQIRNLVETLDLLFDAFGQKRFAKSWTDELALIQQWLNKRNEPRSQ
ncbi:MAG: hypothetical protein U0798_11245 [Gemmataceae bacterium]